MIWLSKCRSSMLGVTLEGNRIAGVTASCTPGHSCTLTAARRILVKAQCFQCAGQKRPGGGAGYRRQQSCAADATAMSRTKTGHNASGQTPRRARLKVKLTRFTRAHGCERGGARPGGLVLMLIYPGMGLESFGVSSPHNNWAMKVPRGSEDGCAGAQCNECHEHKCPANRIGGPEQEGSPFVMSLWEPLEQLPEGEDTVDGGVTDTAGLEAGAEAKIKVDDAAPKVVVTGLPGSGQLTEQEYHVKVEVTDGDRQPERRRACRGHGQPGRASARRTAWRVCARDLHGHRRIHSAAGESWRRGTSPRRAVEDNAGNSVSSSQPFSVSHATPVPVGPGEVDPLSGQFALSASDVAVAGGGGPAARCSVAIAQMG